MWALGAIALLGSEWLVVRDATWRAVAFAVTAAVLGLLSRPLREQRFWLAGSIVAFGTAFVSIVVLAGIWAIDGAEPMRYAIGALAAAAALLVVSALAWGDNARRDLVTVAWATGILSLILGEAFLVGGGPATAFVVALTGAFIALLTTPLHEERLWSAGATVVSVTSLAVLCLVTPPSHFVTASATPAEGLWVALGCVVAGVALRFAAPAVPALDRPDRRHRRPLRALARDPRSRRAHLRRLDRDRLRARACGRERSLDADRARAPDRRPDPRLAAAALRRARRCSASASPRSSSTTSVPSTPLPGRSRSSSSVRSSSPAASSSSDSAPRGGRRRSNSMHRIPPGADEWQLPPRRLRLARPHDRSVHAVGDLVRERLPRCP